MSIDAVSDAQKQHGTFRETVSSLQVKFRELITKGADAPDYELIIVKLLHSFEMVRLNAEKQVRLLKEQIVRHEAEARAASIFGSMLMQVVGNYQPSAHRSPEPTEAPSEMDVLKTICACGCMDDADVAKCKCPCHKGDPCDLPYCVPCCELKGVEPAPHPQAGGNGQ